MVSSSGMCEGFKLEPEEVDMESLLKEEFCCSSGEPWGESGYTDNYLSPESWSRSSLWVGCLVDLWPE